MWKPYDKEVARRESSVCNRWLNTCDCTERRITREKRNYEKKIVRKICPWRVRCWHNCAGTRHRQWTALVQRSTSTHRYLLSPKVTPWHRSCLLTPVYLCFRAYGRKTRPRPRHTLVSLLYEFLRGVFWLLKVVEGVKTGILSCVTVFGEWRNCYVK